MMYINGNVSVQFFLSVFTKKNISRPDTYLSWNKHHKRLLRTFLKIYSNLRPCQLICFDKDQFLQVFWGKICCKKEKKIKAYFIHNIGESLFTLSVLWHFVKLIEASW